MRESSRGVFALTTIVVCLIARPAYALPNPFIVVFIGDLLIQIMLAALLVMPFAMRRIRHTLVRRIPSSAARGAVFGLSVAALALVAASVRPAGLDSVAPTGEAPSCEPLDAELAAELGLPEGAIIVDPRARLSFAAYHLEGSCNVGKDELDSALVRAQLEAAEGPILLIDDTDLLPEFYFKDGQGGSTLPESLRHLRWGSVPGGLKGYYKPNGHAFGWGPAPDAVVDARGRSVSRQLGPIWFMGFQAPLPDTAGPYRRLPAATVGEALREGRPVLDLRHLADAEDRVEGVTHVGSVDARGSIVEAKLRRSLAGAVLLCLDPDQCLAADVLAREAAAAGEPVRGFVRTEASPAELAALDERSLDSTFAAVLLVVLIVSFPLLCWGLGGLAAPLRRRLGGRAIPLAIVIAASLATWLTARWLGAQVASLEPGWASVYLRDAHRFDLDLVLLAAPIALALWIVEGERALGRASNRFRILSVIAVLLGAALADVLGLTVLELAAVEAALVALFVGHGLERWAAARRARAALGSGHDRVVTLEVAAKLAWTGGKVSGLQLAASEGFEVPDGLVVLTRARGPRDAAAVARRLARALGSGPLVFRSTAPDEDLSETPTPGRYETCLDVRLDGYATALEQVLESYRARGVDPDAPVAVLVQRQIRDALAGVAVRMGPDAGGCVSVEASQSSTSAVTAGVGAELRDHLGRRSRQWLLGQAPPTLRAELFIRVFEGLELRLGAPLDLEWAWVAGRGRGRPIVLQVRSVAAPPTTASLVEGDAAQALASLEPMLRWSRPNDVILGVGELSDYRGASLATRELLTDLHRPERLERALRPLWPKLAGLAGSPPLVRIADVLYVNHCVAAPLRRALAVAWQRSARIVLRVRLQAKLRELDRELGELEKACTRASEPKLESAAAAALHHRAALLDRPAGVALRVAYLQAAFGEPGADPDPLLEALAAGGELDARAELQGRAHPDLMLELPRFGERPDHLPEPLAARGETPHATSLGPFAEGVVAETRSTPGTAAFRLRALDQNPGGDRPELGSLRASCWPITPSGCVGRCSSSVSTILSSLVSPISKPSPVVKRSIRRGRPSDPSPRPKLPRSFASSTSSAGPPSVVRRSVAPPRSRARACGSARRSPASGGSDRAKASCEACSSRPSTRSRPCPPDP
ncbi:MAG: hypothetical protein R6X02_26535 [Enhygromyxa sp.]